MSKAVLVAGFAALTAFPVGASAQLPGDYPNRPVRFVIPFAPGGAGDFVGRIVALRLGEVLGQPAIVDNRPGASGYLGVELTAASKADGYTVMLGNNGAVVISPAIYTSSPVRPTRDLTSVSLIVDVPSVLVVHPSLPVKTVRELIELARKYPGKLNFGSPGSASGNRLEMEVFRRAAGVDMIHIPYKGGAGPAVTALVSGETQLMFTTLSSVVSFVKSGRLRALAVTAPSRLPVLPEVPTAAEAGITALSGGSWQGLFFPKDTPGPIVERMFAAIQKTMADDDVRKRLAAGGVEVVVSSSPAEFTRFVATETQKWERAVRDSGATAD